MACTNICFEIKANDGMAWRVARLRGFRLRRKTYKRNDASTIYCQSNYTHVWKNLEERFGKGSTARIQSKKIGYGKHAFYLLQHKRTNEETPSGHYIVIGKVRECCVIWSRFEDASEVPRDLMQDILALVAHLWKGEKHGVSRKRRRVRVLATKEIVQIMPMSSRDQP